MAEEDVQISYEAWWKFIIRPPRDAYDEEMLGDSVFTFRSKTYIRKDFDIWSSEGNILKCSFIEPDEDSRPTEEMPVVVYWHGNSSSRWEGMRMAKELWKHDINWFIFDFAGCGLSEGNYISLGYHEKDDVGVIIDFLERLPGVGRIGLWGRSMGAATSVLYAHNDPRVFAICCDSPFSDFQQLAKELCLKQVNLPNFVLNTALSFIRRTIQKKNQMDIYKWKPIECAEKTKTPSMFIHALNDELINISHSIELVAKYGGEKSLSSCNGGHNSVRPKEVIEKVGNFFAKYLKWEEIDLNFQFDNSNNYLEHLQEEEVNETNQNENL